MKLNRKVTAFQTPVPATPLETAVKNTELQLQFGYSRKTQKIYATTQASLATFLRDIYSLSQ